MPKSIVLVILLSAMGLFAEDWAAIPPEVWAIRSGPKGAVVLEERTKFKGTSVDYLYRVRVFAEEGRSAAGIPDLPTTTFDIKGRTIYPDGRQVLFNNRKDFAERKVEIGGSEASVNHLIAPGITSDCVFEVAWSEPANGRYRGLPERYQGGLYAHFILANSVPTKRYVIEMSKPFPLAWSLDHGSGAKPEESDKFGYRILTFQNLPALEVPPFGLRPSLSLPSLVIFYQPEFLSGASRKDPDAYWQEAVNALYKDDYEEGISKGVRYREFAAAILAGLPEEPTQKAAELMNRLNEKIANLSRPTHLEEATLPKKFWEGFNSKDLGETVKTGKSNSRGMRLLYYHLLKDAGISPKIGKVVDRDVAFFQWGNKNPWQFHHDVIGIDLPAGGTAWIDPTLRHATPGVIHPDYTGVNILQINTVTWKPSRGFIMGRPETANGRKYTYSLSIGEEGDTFEMRGEFTGYPEYAERSAFLPMEPREQGKVLRERFEKAMKNLMVSEATVLNATDPKKDVTWHLKGSIERDTGRSRVVDPFPGMPSPLRIPSQLEQGRKIPIVLPYLSTQIAVSQFKSPPGFKPRLPEEMHMENEFGRVFLVSNFNEGNRDITVTLKVEVKALSKGADRWDAFRTFLGWIETACRCQVVLAKES